LSAPIKFGTDGWRAIIAEDFTFANVRVVAQAVALYLKEAGLAERGLVVGYDTRFASEDFAAAVAEVIAGNGIHVYLCDRPAPTPVVGYSILDRKAGGSAVITSSHNPRQWSGFKFRPEYGGSAPPEVLAQIEAHIPKILASGNVSSLPLAEAQDRGLVETFDPRPPYRRQVARLVDLEFLRAAGLQAIVDSMHGAGAGYVRELASGGKTQIWELRATRNPLFPGMHNPEPIARNLGQLAQAVRRRKADVGLATDGDADRLGVITTDVLNQHQVFALIAYYLLEVRGLRGPLVKSLTTTRMIQRLGQLYNVPVFETAVGFKFLGPKMIAEDAIVAGEESGGYAFRGHLPERDGVVSALYFLDLMARRGRALRLLANLTRRLGHFYDRIDIHLAPRRRRLKRLAGARPHRRVAVTVRHTRCFASIWRAMALVRFGH
jgi:phosphomannomutase